jgi:hypothetical protein
MYFVVNFHKLLDSDGEKDDPALAKNQKKPTVAVRR